MLAYSAGIDDTTEAVFSSRPVAHPLFPVCLEWPVIPDVGGLGLTADEARRGVHAGHDVTLHRPIQLGEDLVTTATVVGVESGRAGAAPWMRLTTTDTSGESVSAVDDLIGDGRRRVARVTGRFAAPVPMPCALTISAHTDGRFDVRLPDGRAAITNGRVEWRQNQA